MRMHRLFLILAPLFCALALCEAEVNPEEPVNITSIQDIIAGIKDDVEEVKKVEEPLYAFQRGFTASFSTILLSEIGDKSFFIAAILAMKHSRFAVFLGASSALALMSVISAIFGTVASSIPRIYTHYFSIVLFSIFGIKMIIESYKMTNEDKTKEMDNVEINLNKLEKKMFLKANGIPLNKPEPIVVQLTDEEEDDDDEDDDDEDDDSLYEDASLARSFHSLPISSQSEMIAIIRARHANPDKEREKSVSLQTLPKSKTSNVASSSKNEEIAEEKSEEAKPLLSPKSAKSDVASCSKNKDEEETKSENVELPSSPKAAESEMAPKNQDEKEAKSHPSPKSKQSNKASSSKNEDEEKAKSGSVESQPSPKSEQCLMASISKNEDEEEEKSENVEKPSPETAKPEKSSTKNQEESSESKKSDMASSLSKKNEEEAESESDELQPSPKTAEPETASSSKKLGEDEAKGGKLWNSSFDLPEEDRPKVTKDRSQVFNFSGVAMEAFSLSFFSEWGDRSQFITIALASREDIYSVSLGAILAHMFCTIIAVVGGRMLAQRLPIRGVTFIGGLIFLIFAVCAFIVDPHPERWNVAKKKPPST